MTDETKKEIRAIMDGLGAICEIAGFLRKQLMANGFTRKESVAMCAEVLVELITLGTGD